ncbi:MAG: hypothetical protein DME35_02270 [Verrucomicrobia bacterium]|nr:MAG: hypothetical protein DME89_12225 [Verrucomicrobiota bacterium]PYK91438.1 MAG: hypothetical protein DME35_02270 [Verrucomicrobiota bacterium]PYL29590.1 MAG: hypothetical protein DMF45_05250 [Verrucomicrobiota bacterium]
MQYFEPEPSYACLTNRRECIMLINEEPDWNIEDLTDVEIYAAIRYLEPESQCPNEGNNDYGVVICVCLDIALIACLAFLWFD